ncbi:MAG: hypothetical protein UH542_08915 [Bacteroidales bacterium]|nr:hypothetical protein [Bacteroidales bacterium]
MPNHVINLLSFDGNESEIKKMLTAIRPDKTDDESPNIDFNKIIPMPEELNIESSTSLDKGLEAYAEFISNYLNLGRWKRTCLDCSLQTLESAFCESKGISEKEWELGKKALINLVKYGAQDWYDWSCEHWGTKWNAYNSKYLGACSSEGSDIVFLTAWAEPEPVILELSKQYPDIVITHSFANEDIGAGCGQRVYSKGAFVYEQIPEGEEAIDFACNLWGYDATEYKEEVGLL